MFHGDTEIIALQNEGVPIEMEESDIMAWCLSRNKMQSAQGKPFTLSQIPGQESASFKLGVIQKLVAMGQLIPAEKILIQPKTGYEQAKEITEGDVDPTGNNFRDPDIEEKEAQPPQGALPKPVSESLDSEPKADL